jgi:hypothetical protein
MHQTMTERKNRSPEPMHELLLRIIVVQSTLQRKTKIMTTL